MLKERLTDELKAAMKSGDQFKTDVLRLMSSALHNKEIELRAKKGAAELDDEAVIAVLKQEAKKRKEAIELFGKGGRNDLADKEGRELAIIQSFLPPEMGAEELERSVRAIIGRTGAKDFGAAMKIAMQELKGRADGRAVGEIIKKILAP